MTEPGIFEVSKSFLIYNPVNLFIFDLNLSQKSYIKENE
jgi:hypothetical protein